MPTVNLSFTVPQTVASDLEAVSGSLGATQSAIVSELLGDTLHLMALCLRDVDANPGPAAVRRARGRSVDLIHKAVSEALDFARDLNAQNFRDDARG